MFECPPLTEEFQASCEHARHTYSAIATSSAILRCALPRPYPQRHTPRQCHDDVTLCFIRLCLAHPAFAITLGEHAHAAAVAPSEHAHATAMLLLPSLLVSTPTPLSLSLPASTPLTHHVDCLCLAALAHTTFAITPGEHAHAAFAVMSIFSPSSRHTAHTSATLAHAAFAIAPGEHAHAAFAVMSIFSPSSRHTAHTSTTLAHATFTIAPGKHTHDAFAVMSIFLSLSRHTAHTTATLAHATFAIAPGEHAHDAGLDPHSLCNSE